MTAALLDLTAARSARGLPPARPPQPAYRYDIGQQVVVIGRPVRRGWIALRGRCQRTGVALYTVQTETSRLVCRDQRLAPVQPGGEVA